MSLSDSKEMCYGVTPYMLLVACECIFICTNASKYPVSEFSYKYNAVRNHIPHVRNYIEVDENNVLSISLVNITGLMHVSCAAMYNVLSCDICYCNLVMVYLSRKNVM